MTLSNHRRMEIHRIFGGEPSAITVFAGSVRLSFGDAWCLVRRSDWRVYMPDDEPRADELTEFGLGERARAAVERREGRWLSAPGPEGRMAQAAFKARFTAARAASILDTASSADRATR